MSPETSAPLLFRNRYCTKSNSCWLAVSITRQKVSFQHSWNVTSCDFTYSTSPEAGVVRSCLCAYFHRVPMQLPNIFTPHFWEHCQREHSFLYTVHAIIYTISSRLSIYQTFSSVTLSHYSFRATGPKWLVCLSAVSCSAAENVIGTIRSKKHLLLLLLEIIKGAVHHRWLRAGVSNLWFRGQTGPVQSEHNYPLCFPTSILKKKKSYSMKYNLKKHH